MWFRFLGLFLSGVFGGSLAVAELAVDVEFVALRVDESVEADPGLVAYLKPYREGVEAFAAEVIGVAAEPLSRSRPESGLSNLVADALRFVGEKEFEAEVDAAVTNFGGLRRNLPAGPLTMGLIAELSPFENYLVFLEVKGELLLELSRQMAEGRASAISGLTVVGKEGGELVSAKIAGRRVRAGEVYRIVSIDYLVATYESVFREEWIVSKQVSTKLVQRDAIVLHLSELSRSGVEVYDAAEGRVTIVK